MKKILFMVNHDVVIYNFRLEIVERFINDGHEVHISSPYGERIDDLVALGAIFHEIKMDRHGMNPLDELKILNAYKKLIKDIRPDICLGFTIKPNIYGAIAARKNGVPFVANITGLGTAVENGGVKQKLINHLYRFSLKKAQKVFFQNQENCDYFLKNKIISSDYDLLPGSGVNLQRNPYEIYPTEEDEIILSMIGRIMKDKGIDEYLAAAREIRRANKKIIFRVIGFFDGEYENVIRAADKAGEIQYFPQQKNIHGFMASSHAIIQPSYHEGMSNVVLEAASTGRPVLVSNISGCKEACIDGKSGLLFEPSNTQELVRAIEKFLSLDHSIKEQMGIEGRKLMEDHFDRNIVVEKYSIEINRRKES